jgi:phage terminase large subunit-like protein
MVLLSPELSKLVRIVPSGKRLVGLAMNTEYRATSAEAGTAHGMSPVLAILDEVGQVKGPHDAFIEAIETSQGAHDAPLLIAISTQAASDADLFSIWMDKAESAPHPAVVSECYSAPEDCDVMDRAAWEAANPALGVFRSEDDLRTFAERAKDAPSFEQSFRWLYLNQRAEGEAPFVSKAVWMACGGEADIPLGSQVWCGLDLSIRQDLTAFVIVARIDGVLRVRPMFWMPGHDLTAKQQRDGARYREWIDAGLIHAVPGKTVDYDYVAPIIAQTFEDYDVQAVAFDRWRIEELKAALRRSGFSEHGLERFVEFGQGYRSMSPALDALESDLLNGKLAHGGNPVLTWCAANARVETDPAGNRKLTKKRLTGRIDGMVALTMARGAIPMAKVEAEGASFWEVAA